MIHTAQYLLQNKSQSYRKLGQESFPRGMRVKKTLQIGASATARRGGRPRRAALRVDLQADRVGAVQDQAATGDAARHEVLLRRGAGCKEKIYTCVLCKNYMSNGMNLGGITCAHGLLGGAGAVGHEVLDQKGGELGLLEEDLLRFFLGLSVCLGRIINC